MRFFSCGFFGSSEVIQRNVSNYNKINIDNASVLREVWLFQTRINIAWKSDWKISVDFAYTCSALEQLLPEAYSTLYIEDFDHQTVENFNV